MFKNKKSPERMALDAAKRKAETIQAVFDEGAAACGKGKPLADCPYYSGQFREAWCSGWIVQCGR